MQVQVQTWRRGEFEISTDPDRQDLAVVHGYLTRSYWAQGIPLDVVRRSIEGSIPFGVYRGAEQVGFARIVSDRATFAWLGDVFILETFQGRGLGKWLMECVVSHPELQGLRRWMLATRDAHGLYAQYGFTPVTESRFMERRDPNVYGLAGSGVRTKDSPASS
jgi:GNAT superfamily N-acetyltransferase